MKKYQLKNQQNLKILKAKLIHTSFKRFESKGSSKPCSVVD